MNDRWMLVAIATCLGLGTAALGYMNARWVPAVLAERATERVRERVAAAAAADPTTSSANAAVVGPTPTTGRGGGSPGSSAVAAGGSAASDRAAVAPRTPAAAAALALAAEGATLPARAEHGPAAPQVAPREASEIVYFEPDRATLGRAARRALDAIASGLTSAGALVAVEVDGHADRRGDSQHNAQLSERRAERVASYLRERGVPEGVLRLRALGETEPADPGFNERAHRRNRRVVVRYRWEEP